MLFRNVGSLTSATALLLVLGLLAAACSISDEDLIVTAATAENLDDAAAETAASTPDVFPGGAVDLDKSRDDIDCTGQGLGNDFTVAFTVAHVVVDGDLGEVCFGELDSRLVSAWESLATITPAGQLSDLALFGGFASVGDEDETTLAFVNALDDAGTVFQMSINLDEGDGDANELLLTMAHEFSHVFTSLSTEVDRDADPASCDTFYNGEGCFRVGSLMAEWVEVFWSDDLLNQIDPFASPSSADGEQRCSLDAGFFGSYAASHPEEDFAESFSAFVFRLESDSDGQAAKMDWFASQPGLLEFQQLATSAGLGPLPNNFEFCGE